MKKIHAVLAALFIALSVARPATAAAVPLINLVGDDASAVVYITDAPALVKNWPGTPWMKMWHDDQVQKYFAPLRAQLKMDEWDERCKNETGCTVAELLGFATGEAVIVLPDLGALVEAAKNKSDPPALIAIEVGDNAAKIEKLVADTEAKDKDRKYTDTTEDFNGITLHVMESTAKNAATPPPPTIWATAGGILYLSPSKDFLEQTLAAAGKGGRDNALGKSDGFMEARHRAGDAQLIFYANVKAMYPAAQKLLGQPPAQGAANPMAFDPATILPALGLDAVSELFISANVGGTSTDLNFGLTYSERRGLTKLISYTDGAPPQPPFVPAKCFAVSSARFSLKAFYATLEETIGNISPVFAGMFQGYVKNFNQRLGIDIKRDFIGSFGDQMIVANTLNESAPDDAPVNERFSQFYAFSLEDATTLTATVESIKRGFFGESADKFFEKRPYLGHDIYTFAPPQPPGPAGAPPRAARPEFAYALTDHWLFLGIGSAASVESALQGLDGKQSSFWDKAEVKRNMLADLPDNACGFSYVDLSKIIPVYLDLAVQGMESSRRAAAARRPSPAEAPPSGGEQEPAEADKPYVDASAKPDAATLAKYWSYSRSYIHQEAGGLYSTSRIAYPQ